MDIEEKKEQIVQSYSKTFDKNMAYVKVGLSEEEVQQLENDNEFQTRLHIFLINEREKIIQNLREFMHSDDEKISFRATVDLAKVLYGDFFNALKDKDPKVNVNVNVTNTEEEDERIESEYGELLGDPNTFKTQ
jgi:hypothetical protein